MSRFLFLLVPILFMVEVSAALNARASCNTNIDTNTYGVGCILPMHEEAKPPTDVSQLAGNDQISVTPYGGNLVIQATDISVPSIGGFGLQVTRTYHSDRLLYHNPQKPIDLLEFQRRRSPLGLGWTFHYGVIWPELNSQTQSLNYELVNGDGTREAFYLNDEASQEMKQLKIVAPPGGDSYVSKSLSVLYRSANVIIVHRPNGLKITFQQLNSISGASMKCLGSVDIGGVAINICDRFVATTIEDLSGNTWKITYDLEKQEYFEHPIIQWIEDDEQRKLEFVYGPPSGPAFRYLKALKFASQPVMTYAVSTIAHTYHFLDAVTTPAGRKTEFYYNKEMTQGPPSVPVINRFGLVTGVKTPLGGGIGVEYLQRIFQTGDVYPRKAFVQAVDQLFFSSTGNLNSREVSEHYFYNDKPDKFDVTITHKVRGKVQATRTLSFHSYATSYCTNNNKVGLEKQSRLEDTQSPAHYIELSTVYGEPLTISNRALNFYCQPSTKPTLYRVLSRTEEDKSSGSAYKLTSNLSEYDFLQPKTIEQSNGLTITRSFRNVISNNLLALGLPILRQVKEGDSFISKMELLYKSGNASHLVDKQNLYYTTSAYDAFTFTYHNGVGKKGAIATATRAGAILTYDYQYGIVSAVQYPGGSTMQRLDIQPNGTYGREIRHAVETLHKWDNDWRLTKLQTRTKEPIHINYCSLSKSECTANFICIGRGGRCTDESGGTATLGTGGTSTSSRGSGDITVDNADSSPGGGGGTFGNQFSSPEPEESPTATDSGSPANGWRKITFDRLGRKVEQKDLVEGNVTSTKQWNQFDYAGRPKKYTDPIRGPLTLSYDVAGRLVKEVGPNNSLITEITRSFSAAKQSETIKKEGVTLFNEDSWSGRPLLRGYQRDGSDRINQLYNWDSDGGLWYSQISSDGFPYTIHETFDLLGRLVSEDRPEIGKVVHHYDGRGFKDWTRFEGLGYRLCYKINGLGQITETRKVFQGLCSQAGKILRTIHYDAATTQPTLVESWGNQFATDTDPKTGTFSNGLPVRRNYTNFDPAGRAKDLTLEMPRGLDAPSPWQGGEVFSPAPNAIDKFHKTPMAFTKVEEASHYEMEVRQVNSTSTLSPTYAWGLAQEECEVGVIVAHDKWTKASTPEKFTGMDIQKHIRQKNPNFKWATHPDTLYCWRVRAVKCHDSNCLRPEISPFGVWGLIAFNNPVARPVIRDGWDHIPTNKNLHVEETYAPCIGKACPNVTVRTDDAVVLTVRRIFNLAGEPTVLQFPKADTSLEGWGRAGSKISTIYNALGDAKKVTLQLPGATDPLPLVDYSPFNSAGSPMNGTLHLYGYADNQPSQFTRVSMTGGDVGHALTPHGSIDLNWSYDDRGRLASHRARRCISSNCDQVNDMLYAISEISYTPDSLVNAFIRQDAGMIGAFFASYDGRSQLDTYTLATSQGAGKADYEFDDQGNLKERKSTISITGLPEYSYSNGMEVKTNQGSIQFPAEAIGEYDAFNRWTDTNVPPNPNPRVTYDNQGRIIKGHDTSFVYSYEDHVETVLDHNGFISQQYVYDGEGNLARMVSGHETHYYLRDERGRLLYEEVHDRWFYGSHFRDVKGRVVPSTRRYEYVYMDDSHIATIEHTAGVSSLAYHIRDWRDFEAVSLDADEAFTRVYREFSPFGREIRFASGNQATADTRLPASYLQDVDAAPYLNNSWRLVNTATGRFNRPDPARARHPYLPQGANLYVNNLNNPLNYRDQDGELAFLIPAAIIAYRVWSAYDTANDVIATVNMVMDPNVATEDLVVAGAGALAGVVLGKAGGKLVKVGSKYGKRAFKRLKKMKSCKRCFAAGTVIHTETGPAAIETVQEGDQILSFDAENEHVQLKPVLQVHHNGLQPTFELSIHGTQGEEILTVTPEHPFFVEGQGWIEARHLHVGLSLATLDGQGVTVTKIRRGPELPDTFNLTVAGFETFGVGINRLVAHNCVTDTAEGVADAALAAGKKRGAAAQFDVGEKTFTDISGPKTNLDPRLQQALDNVPPSQRKPWHGNCAEIGCIDQSLKSGVNPSGGNMKAVNIGKSKPGHKTPKPACPTCANVMDQFGIKY